MIRFISLSCQQKGNGNAVLYRSFYGIGRSEQNDQQNHNRSHLPTYMAGYQFTVKTNFFWKDISFSFSQHLVRAIPHTCEESPRGQHPTSRVRRVRVANRNAPFASRWVSLRCTHPTDFAAPTLRTMVFLWPRLQVPHRKTFLRIAAHSRRQGRLR